MIRSGRRLGSFSDSLATVLRFSTNFKLRAGVEQAAHYLSGRLGSRWLNIQRKASVKLFSVFDFCTGDDGPGTFYPHCRALNSRISKHFRHGQSKYLPAGISM
jgi:hypothetical protein